MTDCMSPGDNARLPCHISSNNGEGEGSMQVFISQHMTQILQPLAERIKDLEALNERLANRLDVEAAQGHRTKDELGQHAETIRYLDTRLGEVDFERKTLQASCDRAHESYQWLERDHSTTKEALGHLRSRADVMAFVDATEKRVTALETMLEQSRQGHEKAVEQVRIESTSRQVEFLDNLRDIDKRWNKTEKALGSLESSAEGRHRDLLTSVEALDERTRGLGRTIDDMLNTLRRHDKAFRDQEGDFMGVRRALKDIDHFMASSRDRAETERSRRAADEEAVSQVMSAVRALQVRTDTLGEDIACLARTSETQAGLVNHLIDSTNVTAEELRRKCADIQRIDEQLPSHANRLTVVEDRGGKLHAEHQSARERVDTLEVRLDKLTETHASTVTQVDSHGFELHQQRACQIRLGESIDEANLRANRLTADIDATNGIVAKVSARSELAHEYVQGLSKGFQDTHKRLVAGHDAMLSPKGSYNRTLPVLQSSFRGQLSGGASTK
eukprot:TRINITY_DN56040_c0_g1_i1.p1 TRINITY_DN56040_c0_g1~~TRINITY_DN56040_c0_g1_i1.p1  ORF type:complete len:518 (+),score=49.65 TRINITY_DN56040_c0_g1_i1:54-1556(+)